jgi:hypothetical protein
VLVLAATLKFVVPFPLPVAPPVTVIQDAVLDAVHVQPVPAFMENDPDVPDDGAATLSGTMSNVQGAAACVTLNVRPPAVIEPVRCDVVVFAATLYPMVPFPLPLAPLVTVSHQTLLAAVHVQPVPALIANVPLAPPAAADKVLGEIAYVQTAEKENPFDTPLGVAPPGPTADTRASYITFGAGTELRRAMKSTRILPSPAGAGLPRLTVAKGVAPPC